MGVIIKSEKDIEGIREAGRIIKKLFEELKSFIKPGMTTEEVNFFIERFIKDFKAEAVFKGYRGYPAASCISINEEVIHGIPGKKRIKEGDLVKIDVGVRKNGYIADAAYTFEIGEVEPSKKKLVEITKKALKEAIKKARAGNRVGDISSTIERIAKENGFDVIREYTGHGVGLKLHEEPMIPNFGKPGVGRKLEAGMTIAIEPMLVMGTWRTEVGRDKWTVITQDRKPSAHFEHTVLIKDGNPEVLTDGEEG